MKKIAIEYNNELIIGNIRKIAKFIGVHPNTISRWLSDGDRIVYKNGSKIFLIIKDL